MAAQETSTMTQAQVMDFISGLASSAGLEIKFAQESENPQKEKRERKPRKLPKTISEEQFAKLIGKISTRYNTGKRNVAMLNVMYRAALRVAEVCSLTPADVNMETGMITVQDGKGGKDRRVPMGSALIESLSKWIAARPDSVYFFCTHKGGKISTRYVRAMLERVSIKADVYIQDREEQVVVFPHSLRHSCATRWLNDGLSVIDVQELLGHESLNTTQKYLHVSMKDLDAKIKALG